MTRAIVLAAVLAVAACSKPSTEDLPAALPHDEQARDDAFWLPSNDGYRYSRRVEVWVDPDTGCHYLVTQYGEIRMTPRLSEVGAPLCVPEHKLRQP